MIELSVSSEVPVVGKMEEDNDFLFIYHLQGPRIHKVIRLKLINLKSRHKIQGLIFLSTTSRLNTQLVS